MEQGKLKWQGFCLLALLLLALGWFFVPSHWTSIWFDLEFSDWVSPIANRLGGGARLYEQGLHSPMPPLPFVLVRLLHPHGAVWYDESLLNFSFQAGTLLLLYYVFAKRVGAPVAFASALATLPVFFSLSKTMLYDSQAQFLTAACGVAAASLVLDRPATVAGVLQPVRWLALAWEGLLLALLMLTKQSTGAGVVAGVCITLLFLPRAEARQRRFANVALVLLFMIIATCVIGLALTPYLSFSGMIHDVFITGSQPKGGTATLLVSLPHYAFHLAAAAVMIFCCGCIFVCFFWGRMPVQSASVLFGAADGRQQPGLLRLRWRIFQLLVFAAASVAGMILVLAYVKTHKDFLRQFMDRTWGDLFLILGLVPCMALTTAVIAGGLARLRHDAGKHPLAPYAVVFFLGALGHNLSSMALRLLIDNNPLIFLDMVFVMSAIEVAANKPRGVPSRLAPVVQTILISFIIVAMWPLMRTNLAAAAACKESWPEIKHLANAKLRPQSGGMRAVVQAVRSYADQPDDSVLLLPEDPNIAAWFERKRPELSCAIIFTDQYWDRYVEEDFARLQAHPPQVIVVGPCPYWRHYSRYWNENRGAERLVDLVQNNLLANDYELKLQQPISYNDGNETNFMDVYSRRKK